jgi:hypothetical protein
MSNEAIRPSSLEGIKRLAKSIKTERGIQHVHALDAAAQLGGFQNFRHAKNALHSRVSPDKRHPVFLTVYWKDREKGGTGRETLTITLSVPWGDLITPAQFKYERTLSDFRSEGPDHLARSSMAQSQSQARSAACAAARALHFMDATKLRPSKSYRKAYPDGRPGNVVPGHDHTSIWYDRESKRYLLVDEPYELAAESKVAERTAWAQRHGFDIVKPEWAGMYNPDGGTRLYLVADAKKGIPLEPVTAALNRLPAPIDEETWDGESAPTVPYFISPGTIARASAVKEKAQTPRKSNGQRNSVEYIQTFVGPQRRPKGKMSIAAHTEVGGLLKSVLVATYHRKGAYNRVNTVRSELDEWVQREYSSTELPNEQFFDLYYHETDSTFSRSLPAEERDRHVGSLAQVKKVLVGHYPDCPPLRLLLKKIDAAIKSLLNWAS